ncbi:hypothetical protein [Nocardia sp. 348MFTsu5.1]|uniref:hypothetical protein n=1 Tax=Nocardia sp. 348MFTsu5.1 TaxID=1172185 RepID=UPI000377F67B|nr:hypothetical protein [Nocardia sp. 348MFTsu5.1]
MGKGPGTGADLQFELATAREVAKSGLEFFAHVAPLASRLGITDFPEFSVFEGRFCQTDDLSTAQLRADGAVMQQLHATLASQVDVQKQQHGALACSWPDGSGIVAQQQLQSILPRAEADLAAISGIGTGMLVAADCIDVARFIQYTCIAGIDPHNLLGVPITLWLKMTMACIAHHTELRGAIAATVELFGTAVSACDEAIEAILSGLCTAMAEVDTSDYPATGSGPVGQLTGVADAPSDQQCSGDQPVRGGTPAGGGTLAGSGAQSGATPVASGGPMTQGAGTFSGGLAGESASELLGPLLGVVGTIASAAVTGLAEAITTVVAQGGLSVGGMIDTAPVGDSAGPAAVDGSLDATASITLGDKVIEIAAGPDGASVNLTVTGAGGDAETHVLEVRPDGSIGAPEVGTGEVVATGQDGSEPTVETQGVQVDVEPDAEAALDGRVVPPTASETPCPPVEPGEVAPGPEVSPQSPALPVPGFTHRTPGVSDNSPNPNTAVSPQSSAPDDAGPPPEDGQLALAGEQ